MIVLDATTRSLEVVLGGAVAANQLPVVATYVDVTTTSYSPASSNTVTNGNTAVTAVSAPASSTQRQVKLLSVYNADTAAAAVTVQYNDNGTKRKVLVPTVQSGETLLYTDGEGWRVLDANGAVKHAWTGYQIARGSGYAQVNADGSVTVSAAASGTTLTGGVTVSGSGDALLTVTETSASTFTEVIFQNTAGGQVRVEWGMSADSGTRPSKGMVLFASAGGCGWADYEARPLQFYTGTVAGTSNVALKIDAGGGLHSIVGNVAGNQFLSCEYDQSGHSYGNFQIQAGAWVFMAGTANPKIRFAPYNSGTYDANLGLTVDAAGNVGAGTNAPATALDVSGAVTIRTGNYLDLKSGSWVRNDPGKARMTTSPTNATTTVSNLSDLSLTLVAGRKYFGHLVLIANNSTGGEGLKVDFNGGTATMTSFEAVTEGTAVGATVGTTSTTALGTALTWTAVSTSDQVYEVALTLVCNAGGTFFPRFAENSHSTGTATVKAGSWLLLDDSPN